MEELTKNLNATIYPLNGRKWPGMRDKLIHDYFGVDYEIVWNAIREKLPPLQEEIRRILEKPEA